MSRTSTAGRYLVLLFSCGGGISQQKLLGCEPPNEVFAETATHGPWIDCQPCSSVDAFKGSLGFTMWPSTEAAHTSILELNAGLESRRFLNELASLNLTPVPALMTNL